MLLRTLKVCCPFRTELLFENFNTLFCSTCSRLIVSSMSTETKEIANEARLQACYSICGVRAFTCSIKILWRVTFRLTQIRQVWHGYRWFGHQTCSQIQFIFMMYNGLHCLLVKISYSDLCTRFGTWKVQRLKQSLSTVNIPCGSATQT